MSTSLPYRFACAMSVFTIPGHMVDGLKLYVEKRIPQGPFLTAVLANDLIEAVQKADARNLNNLPAYADYMYNEMPMDSYGSRAIVKAWLENKPEETPDGP